MAMSCQTTAERMIVLEFFVAILEKRLALLHRSAAAIETCAAAGSDRPNNPIAGLDCVSIYVANIAGNIPYVTQNLMPQDGRCWDLSCAADRMQITAAQCTAVNFYKSLPNGE